MRNSNYFNYISHFFQRLFFEYRFSRLSGSGFYQIDETVDIVGKTEKTT